MTDHWLPMSDRTGDRSALAPLTTRRCQTLAITVFLPKNGDRFSQTGTGDRYRASSHEIEL